VFVGHAPMATNIPLALQSFEWDPAKKGFHWDFNPGFLPAVQAWAKPGDTLLVSCRSGGRSAMGHRPPGEGRLHGRLEHRRRHGGRPGQGPRQRLRRHAHEERLEELRPPWTYEIHRERMVLPKREAMALQPGNDAD
jgi:hypothetical protein